MENDDTLAELVMTLREVREAIDLKDVTEAFEIVEVLLERMVTDKYKELMGTRSNERFERIRNARVRAQGGL